MKRSREEKLENSFFLAPELNNAGWEKKIEGGYDRIRRSRFVLTSEKKKFRDLVSEFSQDTTKNAFEMNERKQKSEKTSPSNKILGQVMSVRYLTPPLSAVTLSWLLSLN